MWRQVLLVPVPWISVRFRLLSSRAWLLVTGGFGLNEHRRADGNMAMLNLKIVRA
jgi:hypothetical protein